MIKSLHSLSGQVVSFLQSPWGVWVQLHPLALPRDVTGPTHPSGDCKKRYNPPLRCVTYSVFFLPFAAVVTNTLVMFSVSF